MLTDCANHSHDLIILSCNDIFYWICMGLLYGWWSWHSQSSFLLIANLLGLIANSKDFIVAANSLAFDCQRVRYPWEVCLLERIWGIYWFSLCSKWSTGKLLPNKSDFYCTLLVVWLNEHMCVCNNHFMHLIRFLNSSTSVDKWYNFLIIFIESLLKVLCVLQVRSSYRAGELFVKTMVREKTKNAGDS